MCCTMECHREADEDTLLNYWVVDEAKTCVKVYQRFTSLAAFQFHHKRRLGKVRQLSIQLGCLFLGTTGDLDFLRAHGAFFMLNL